MPLRVDGGEVDETCRCEDGDDCWYMPGYPWCRPCKEHHRAPECDIDEQGRALNRDTGEPWEGGGTCS